MRLGVFQIGGNALSKEQRLISALRHARKFMVYAHIPFLNSEKQHTNRMKTYINVFPDRKK